jgi:hypothetical protein
MPLPSDPTADAAARARARRLEARLAVYAQYAAVVAEQAAAAVAGDAERAGALDAARAQVAEHFAELRAPTGAADGAPPAPSFRAALDDALAELAHQGAVDSALGAHLAALRDAALRGAAWAGTAEAPRHALAAGAAEPGPAADAGPDARPDARPDPELAAGPDAVPAGRAGHPAAAPDPVAGVLGGALVAARAAGVGGALGGQFPGLATRDEYPPAWPGGEAGAPDADDAPHVDIRF